MANVQPYQIIMAPYVVYIAPVGTAFPAVDAAPSGSWSVIGASGTEDYDEDGVTVNLEDKIEGVRGAGSTGTRKVSRTEEDMVIGLKIMDMSLEQFRHVLNENAITTVAAASGVAGNKSVQLYKGVDVQTVALLVRGPSPYAADKFMQFEVPNCYQSGKPKPQFSKGKAAMLEMEFTALTDPNASTVADRFGKLRAYTAPALP